MILWQAWSLTVFVLNALVLADSKYHDQQEEVAEVTDKLLVLSGNTVVASSVNSPDTGDDSVPLTNLQYDAVADDVGIAVKLNTDSLGAILGEVLKLGNKFQSATSGKVTKVGLSAKDQEINTENYNQAGIEVDEKGKQELLHEGTSNEENKNHEVDLTYGKEYDYDYLSQGSFDYEDENQTPTEELATERSRSINYKVAAQEEVSSGSETSRFESEEASDEQAHDTGIELEAGKEDEKPQSEDLYQEETVASDLKQHKQDRFAGHVTERHKSGSINPGKQPDHVNDPAKDTRLLTPVAYEDKGEQQQDDKQKNTRFEEDDFTSSENSTNIFDSTEFSDEFLNVEIDFGGVDDPDGVVEEIMEARRRQRQRFGRRRFFNNRRRGRPPRQRFPTDSHVGKSDAKSGGAVVHDNSGLQIFPFVEDLSPTVSNRLYQAGFFGQDQTPPPRRTNQPPQRRTRFREPDVERRGRRRPQHNRRPNPPPHRRQRNRYNRRHDEHFDQQQPTYYELQQRALHHAYGKNAYVSPPVDEADHYDRRPRGHNPSRHLRRRHDDRHRFHEEGPGYFDDHPRPHHVYDDESDYGESKYRKPTRKGYQRSHRPSFKSHGYGYKPKKKKKHKKVPVYVPISFKKKKKKKMKILSIYKGFKVEGGQQVAKSVKSLEQCMKLCGITPNCFAGDYNKWTYKCYLFDETNACDDLDAHPKVIHFQKVPCELDDLDDVEVNLGQQAFGGIIQKGVKSLTACLKLCDKIGGRDEDFEDRDCFGIDYDFATHKCYIFVDDEDVCDEDDLVENSSVVNIRYCNA